MMPGSVAEPGGSSAIAGLDQTDDIGEVIEPVPDRGEARRREVLQLRPQGRHPLQGIAERQHFTGIGHPDDDAADQPFQVVHLRELVL